MKDFFEIAKTDFMATFAGGWLFPLLLVMVLIIIWKEEEWHRKILAGILPAVLLAVYWCPLTGMAFMRLLGENVYWRILWLVPLGVTIPYGMCLLLKRLQGIWRQCAFLFLMVLLAFCGSSVLSTEWFEPSTNIYKLPQNVIDICEILPGNIHAMVSNRLMPYIRQCDPTITLAYGRNALSFNGMTEDLFDNQIMYLEAQKPEIDVDVLGPLVRDEGCTFLVFSLSRTYVGDWADYGYREYAVNDEFRVFVDEDYKEGQDTRKWED